MSETKIPQLTSRQKERLTLLSKVVGCVKTPFEVDADKEIAKLRGKSK